MDKKNIYIVLFILNSVLTIAQTPTYNWAKTAGGLANDYGNSICTDTNSNIYICGEFNSDTITFGNIKLPNAGSKDMYIVKYDSSGNVLWAKSFGGTGDESASCVCTDPLGNAYLTGSFVSDSLFLGNDTLINNNTDTTEDCFIVKIDTYGNVIWCHAIGGLGADLSYGVSTDAASNIYMTGYFNSPTILFDTTTITNVYSGTNDLFLFKFNSSGNKIWAKSIGGNDNEDVRGIETDSYGNIFVIGEYNSSSVNFGTTTLNNNGDYDLFIVNFNSIGNVLWAKSFGGVKDEKSIDISIDSEGNIYTTGFYLSQHFQIGSFQLNNVSIGANGDIWIAKYNNSGDILWAKSEGGTLFDKGIGITTDADGNAYLTGYFISDTLIFGSDTLFNAGSSTRDFYITKYNNIGNPNWAYSAGGTYEDFGFSNCIFENSLYIIGKYNSPNITFGGFQLTNMFNTGITSDIFIVKMDIKSSSSGFNEISDKNSEIKLFPNPAKNAFTIIIDNAEVNSEVLIYNIMGKLVKSELLQNKQKKINIDNLNNGIYIIEIKSKNKTQTQKLIIEK